ncbi:unnamed protein product, partial [Discosporangium mesarthrocarpum]
VDLAELSLVSCQFHKASKICLEGLERLSVPPLSRRSPDDSGGRQGCPLVRFGECWTACLGECNNADLLAAVLLQCGYELRRRDEWERCRLLYKDRGRPMPFVVATLWLRLLLADGEVVLPRAVLTNLRAALGEECRRHDRMQEGRQESSTAYRNYAVVMSLLVTHVMLPMGECGQAIAMLANDVILSPDEKFRLTAACQVHAEAGRRDDILTSSVDFAPGGNQPRPQGASQYGGDSGESDVGDRGVEKTMIAPGLLRQNRAHRLRALMMVGVAGIAAYTAFRNRKGLWRATRRGTQLMWKAAGDLGSFIVGSS